MNAFRFESVATQAVSDATPQGSATDYLPGEVIADRYRLTRELGRGGMGVVWAAQSLALGVEVAVKLIHSDASSDSSVGRMMREAQAVARVSHPSLVRVFDFGFTKQSHPFLVMELVQGETLRDQLERNGALAPIEAVRTLLPIADGLRAAHENKIVHRDLKPDNVFMARDGLNRVQPKLLDFGIAKDTAATSKLTQTGMVIGTPQYISPEQARGLDSVDARSDVWSFSVMLYELLTGNLPFDEDNYNAQLFAIIERSPREPKRRPGDARLWQILLHGLTKDPSDRFQTIGELGEVLAAWLYDHGVKVDIAGNSLRTVWLDNATTATSVSPMSKPLRVLSPKMGSSNSRIPPGRANTLRGVGLVLAVAASVFGLFELTFAKPTASAPAPLASAQRPSQRETAQYFGSSQHPNGGEASLALIPKRDTANASNGAPPRATRRTAAKKTSTRAGTGELSSKSTSPIATNPQKKALAATPIGGGNNPASQSSRATTQRAQLKPPRVESTRHDFGF